MKKIKSAILIILALSGISILKTQAQRLPATQKESVLAPANIKIDGKADEWGNHFKAYNNSTEIFYTLANDDKNLYLIVRAIRSVIIGKIFGGGITFTIKNSSSNKAAVPVSITSPIVAKSKRPHILHPIGDTSVNMAEALPGLNNELEANSKEISLTGFDDITDSVISVYNEYGIKTAQLINDNRAWTYELAIPLKYISQLVNIAGELKYDIKLNGLTMNSYNMVINGKPTTTANANATALFNEIASKPGSVVLDQTSTTDFSATYKLAK